MLRLNALKTNFIASLCTKMSCKFSKLDLDLHRQKSYIAQICIASIQKERSFKEIKQLSLPDQIKQNLKYFTMFDKKLVAEMLEIFTKGVEVDTLVFDQSRHMNEIYTAGFKPKTDFQPKNFAQNLLFKDQKGAFRIDIQPKKKLIRYFPTTLISSQVFRNILHSQKPFELLVGHKGVSKSISLQLYSFLSNIVIQYLCREQHNGKMPELLIYKNGIPKLFYLAINPYEGKSQVRRKILRQCPQIGQNLENSSYLTDGGQKISEFYRLRSINTTMAFDQSGALTNRYQQRFYGHRHKDETEVQYKKRKERISKEYNTILDNYYMLFEQGFSRKLFCSSVYIQQYLLQQMNLTRQGNQIRIQTKRIPFEEYLSTQKARYQLIDYFMFEVRQKIRTPLFQSPLYIDDNNKSVLRQRLFEKIESQSTKIYVTPLKFSQKLREQVVGPQKMVPLDSSLSNEKFVEKAYQELQKLLETCIQDSRQKLRQQIKHFLNKVNKNQKMMILSQMFLQKHSLSKKNSSQEKNFYQQESSQKFFFDVKSLIKDKSVNEMNLVYNPEKSQEIQDASQKSEIVDNYIDKQLFQYHSNGKVSCYFDYQDIEEFLGPLHADVIEFILSFNQQMINQVRKGISDGRNFETFFIQTFSRGMNKVDFIGKDGMDFTNLHNHLFGFVQIPNPAKSIKTDTSKNTKGYKNNKNNDQNQTIQKEIENYQFFESFKKSFNYIQKNKIKEAVFVPISEDFKNLKFLSQNPEQKQKIAMKHISIYNPSIDLIFMKYTTSLIDDTIDLLAIDLTIKEDSKKEKDSAEILNKLNKFLNNFSKFKDNGLTTIDVNGKKARIQLHYCVLSPSGGQTQNLQKIINSQAHNFGFGEFKNKTIEVKSVLNHDTCLKSIGTISMSKESMHLYKGEKSSIKSLWFFDKLSKAIEYHSKK